MAKLSAVQRRSTATDVVAALRDAIMSGRLAFGEPIIEQLVCAEMQVSRTPLREALRELQGAGLVDIVPYKGARVFQLGADEMEDLGDFRRVLEQAALNFAMRTDLAGLTSCLEDILRRMILCFETPERIGYGLLDTEFHQTILVHSANPYLIAAQNNVAQKIEALRNRIQYDAAGVTRSIAQHRAVVETVRSGDIAAATQVLGQHIQAGTRYFCNHLVGDPLPSPIDLPGQSKGKGT